MNLTIGSMLALFNLGGGEIILILATVIVAVITLGVIVALVLFLSRSGKNVAAPSAGQVPAKPGLRKCPQCGVEFSTDMPEGLCPACLLRRGIATEGGAPPGTPAFTPPPLTELAKLFPQLEILEIIGQGGMGAVYKARQPALERFVALKILAPRSGGDLDFAGRFSREARALAKLSHPNIVAVYDFGQIQRSRRREETDGGKGEANPPPHVVGYEASDLSYFIMEYVDGPNLREVERAGKLTPREALEIIPQICVALQFAHDEGIVHRDIKPENVLLDKKGRVKIADFGLAKILGQETNFRLTGARDVMGTPHYMAPEQVEKPQEVDHRADIYSLGVVFYEMLTGELPLGKFDPPSHKVQIDVRLDDVVLRSLANNPDRRYQSVSEVRTEVEAITTSNQGTYRVPPGFKGVDYRSKRTLFGVPLVHIASGMDPATGKVRTAKGIIAIGGRAQGVLAIGGLAMGGVAIGGGAVGLVALGGAAIGLFSFGGMAVALILALGGGAIAPIALGGGAFGFMALGGGGWGAHAWAANAQDPMARDFFGSWGPNLLANAQVINAIMVILGVGIGVGGPFWIQRRGMSNSTSGGRATAIPQMSVGDKIGTGILGAFAALVVIAFFGLMASLAIPGFVKIKTLHEAAPQSAHVPQPVLEASNVSTAASMATNPPASAETWMPTIEQPDVQKILEEADDLMKHGKYEESLGRHIWLQHYQTERGSYQNVSAIISWVELGRRYSKARRALIEIRDGEVREFAEGRGFQDLFSDIVSINQQLQDEDSTYALFKAISKGDPQLAAQCRPWVEGIMLSKGEYQWGYDNMGEPQSRLSQAKGNFEMQIGMYQRSAESQKQSRQRMEEFNRQRGITNQPPAWYSDSSGLMFNSATNSFVGAVGMIIEVLLGTGHPAEGAEIRDQALAYMEEPRLKSAVGDAEARIEKRKAAALESSVTNRPATNSANLSIPSPTQGRPVATNMPDASRETWEPALAPGAKPDLMAIQQEAKDLMERHQYEEALQREIWYHNHSISDPTQAGVRNSFALGDWIELGRRYPKAMQALIEIRDENARKISAGEGFFELFLETASMNRELGNQEMTRALFKQLASLSDKTLAQRCFPVAEDVLVSYGDYELCRSFIGEPASRFKNIREQWQRSKNWEKQQDDTRRQMEERVRAMQSNRVAAMPAMPSAISTPKMADKRFIAQTRQLIEILVANHSGADAEKIRDEAVLLLDDPALKSAVEDAGKKILKTTLDGEAPSVGNAVPVVVETLPASGARDVAAGETEIRVRFSKVMEDDSWSWSTAWENSAPPMIGSPRYASDGRTCIVKVKLELGRTYAWWLNSDTFHNFKDKAGGPAVPYLLIFQTKPK